MIRVQNLSKHYGDPSISVHALKNINLEIHPGERVALIGQSGAGKSTLMYLLGLMDLPSEGDVQLFGKSTASLDDRARSELRRNVIGFVFQGFNLLPQLKAWENVALPLKYAQVKPKERKLRAHEMLEQIGLLERANHTPNQLSGGQEQRVAIARALVMKPRLILADEPTGNLDRASGEVVLGLLEQAHRGGATVVTVTHNHEIAARSERIVEIEDGQISSDKMR